jgi:hypothetical protein
LLARTRATLFTTTEAIWTTKQVETREKTPSNGPALSRHPALATTSGS